MTTSFTPQGLLYDRQIKREKDTLDLIRHGTKDKDGYWIPGPLWFAWYATQTCDYHYLDKGLATPYRSFPRLPYLPWLFAKLLTEKIVLVPKSREMMLSWAVMAYCVWACEIFPSTQVLVQSQKLDKASELVKGHHPPGYAFTLWDRQDPWLKKRFPLAMRPQDLPADKISWQNGSSIQGVGKGADQIRLFHPSIAVWDESAYIDEFGASLGAALPVAKQVIAVSSAGPGTFGDLCSQE